MRCFLRSYVGLPQFAGATHETVGEDAIFFRRVVRAAACPCFWTGLIGKRAAGVSDGQLYLCDTHAPEEPDQDDLPSHPGYGAAL